ncbi:MAG: hypothetical protein ACK5NN_04395 [Sphingomonadaceae bacterium]
MTRSPHPVRPDVQAFLDMLAATSRPPYYELPLDEARAGAKAMVAMLKRRRAICLLSGILPVPDRQVIFRSDCLTLPPQP